MPQGPAPVSEYPTVQLNKNVRLNHPWVFGRLLDKPSERIPPGTVVDAVNADGTFAGRGFYNARARIGLRVLTTDQSEVVDAAFFARRLSRGLDLARRRRPGRTARHRTRTEAESVAGHP